MNPILLNIILEYTKIMKSSDDFGSKHLKIKELSFLLHNELYKEFEDAIGSEILNEYYFFKETAEKFLSTVDPQEIKINLVDSKQMISFRGKTREILSPMQISNAFLENVSKEQLFLFCIFLSNDEDILRMNIIC